MKLFRRRWGSLYPARISEAAQAFIAIEASSGIVLVVAGITGFLWVNSPLAESYESLWQIRLGLDTRLISVESDLRHLVNDGLMTGFFFLMGLEIKRELVQGEMSSLRRALLPAVAALGGMATPALIYTAFNLHGSGAGGWGVPMATDIAFSLGVLSLLASRVPFSAKVFLLAIAIADDIGAVIVIAVFYTSSIDAEALALALTFLGIVLAMNRLGVRNIGVYVAAGAAIWLATFESGLHATLTGVALGLLTPATSAQGKTEHETVQDADTVAPLDRLERAIHPWVSYAIVPLFALANAGVVVGGGVIEQAMESRVTHGVVLGLLIGKPLGIFGTTWLAVRLRLCELPAGSNWGHILGIGMLAGIGFTVSLLIAGLAFQDPRLATQAKFGVLVSSVSAGLLAFLLLRLVAVRSRVA